MGWVGISHCNHTFQFHKMFLIVKFALHLIIVNLEIIFFRKDHKGEKVTKMTCYHQVCQLEDVNGEMVDIYLYNGDMLPVPRFIIINHEYHHYQHRHHLIARFYWKIIIDPAAGSGVAIVGVNKQNRHHYCFIVIF